MPLRNVATTFTIEQQRLEINALAGDVNNIATGVTNVGTAATANALAAGATGADLTLSGTLTVNGTQTILNTETLQVEDKEIVIGNVSSPTDATAHGGGWKLKGANNKTITYNQTGDKWVSNKDFEAPNLIGAVSGVTGSPATVAGNLQFIQGTPELEFNNGGARLTVQAANSLSVHTGGGIGTTTSEVARFTNTGLSITGGLLETQGGQEYTASANSLATSVTKAALRVKGATNSSDSLWVGVENVNAFPYLQGSNGTGNNAKNLLLNPYGGNVGINVDNPTRKLDVRANENSDVATFINSDLTNGYGINVKGGGTAANRYALRIANGADTECFKVKANGYAEFAGSNDLRITIGNTGTAGENSSNWIRAEGANFLYNAASGHHKWEIGGTEAGKLTSSGWEDGIGNLRSIPYNGGYSSTTLAPSHAGQVLDIQYQLSVPSDAGIVAGQTFTIINGGSSNTTIVQGSGLTMYNAADASTGDKTLAAKGMCTLWFQSTTVCYISGAGLS